MVNANPRLVDTGASDFALIKAGLNKASGIPAPTETLNVEKSGDEKQLPASNPPQYNSVQIDSHSN